MKRNKIVYLLLLVTLFVTAACKSDKKGNPNWMKEDDVNVAIDETFKPIMDNLVQSYGMAYPEANIVAIDYDPGAPKVNQENRIKLMLSSAE